MTSAIVITAADAQFFGLLCDLMLSLDAHNRSCKIDVGLLDLGLTAAQRDWVTPRVTRCVEPGWDLDVPQSWRSNKPNLRALTVRPFLPQHFPGYDVYIWMDADVWLQDLRGLELYILGARKCDITVTPHTDRSYPFIPAVTRYRHRLFKQGYGEAVADFLTPQQHMNAGVFSSRTDSPLWRLWAAAYQEAIARSSGAMFSEQIALNYACYRNRLGAELLPALYNWQCHLAVPSWDPASQLFCEPSLPHTPISIVHLTHKAKSQTYKVRCLDSRCRSMSLRRPQDSAYQEPTLHKLLSDERLKSEAAVSVVVAERS